MQQDAGNGMYLVARTSSRSGGAIGRRGPRNPCGRSDVPVYGIRTMQDRLYDSLARQRFSSTMLGAFAGFALLLAAWESTA